MQFDNVKLCALSNNQPRYIDISLLGKGLFRYKILAVKIPLSYSLQVQKQSNIKKPPKDGCFINGLFLEGARWDYEEWTLVEARNKELFSKMPPIHLIPLFGRTAPETGVYFCPVYKTLTRAGEKSGNLAGMPYWHKLNQIKFLYEQLLVNFGDYNICNGNSLFLPCIVVFNSLHIIDNCHLFASCFSKDLIISVVFTKLYIKIC